MDDDWIEIGTVVGAHGLKGELKVYPSSDFPERFEQPGKRWLQNPHTQEIQEVELLVGRDIPGRNLYVLIIDKIEERERAEALKGYKLLVESSDRPELEEDEYHVSELIDLEVYHRETGENLGIVIDVYTAGNDLLEVKLHKQPKVEVEILLELDENNLSDKPVDDRRKSKQKKKNKSPKPATIFIPFVKEIVPIVDIKNGRIEITPPPGLLELASSDK
jgi:16S rRNA processing protein RimM